MKLKKVLVGVLGVLVAMLCISYILGLKNTSFNAISVLERRYNERFVYDSSEKLDSFTTKYVLRLHDDEDIKVTFNISYDKQTGLCLYGEDDYADVLLNREVQTSLGAVEGLDFTDFKFTINKFEDISKLSDVFTDLFSKQEDGNRLSKVANSASIKVDIKPTDEDHWETIVLPLTDPVSLRNFIESQYVNTIYSYDLKDDTIPKEIEKAFKDNLMGKAKITYKGKTYSMETCGYSLDFNYQQFINILKLVGIDVKGTYRSFEFSVEEGGPVWMYGTTVKKDNNYLAFTDGEWHEPALNKEIFNPEVPLVTRGYLNDVYGIEVIITTPDGATYEVPPPIEEDEEMNALIRGETQDKAE